MRRLVGEIEAARASRLVVLAGVGACCWVGLDAHDLVALVIFDQQLVLQGLLSRLVGVDEAKARLVRHTLKSLQEAAKDHLNVLHSLTLLPPPKVSCLSVGRKQRVRSCARSEKPVEIRSHCASQRTRPGVDEGHPSLARLQPAGQPLVRGASVPRAILHHLLAPLEGRRRAEAQLDRRARLRIAHAVRAAIQLLEGPVRHRENLLPGVRLPEEIAAPEHKRHMLVRHDLRPGDGDDVVEQDPVTMVLALRHGPEVDPRPPENHPRASHRQRLEQHMVMRRLAEVEAGAPGDLLSDVQRGLLERLEHGAVT